jgi:hypothetical protein
MGDGPHSGLVASDQVAGVGRHINRLTLQDIQRYDVQGALVGRGKNHRSGNAIPIGLQPPDGHNAPPVSGLQPGKRILGSWGGQVVSHPLLMSQELSGEDDTYRVTAQISRAGVAAAITIEPGHGVGATLLQRAAEDIES